MPRSMRTPKSRSWKGLPFREINGYINFKELRKRLKTCLSFVEGLTEDKLEPVKKGLLFLVKNLVSQKMVDHKEQEVPLLTSCILVHIVQLSSSSQLFEEGQIEIIFNLLISQLFVLKNPTDSLFNQACTLLEKISTLRVFVYAFDIEGGDIISKLFEKVVSVVNESQSSQVQSQLLNILVDIIQETKSGLPVKALDAMISCTIEPQKSQCSAACDLVTQLIKTVPCQLEQQAHKLYVDAIATGSGDESGPSSSHHIYYLICAMHKIDSSVALPEQLEPCTSQEKDSPINKRKREEKEQTGLEGTDSSQLAADHSSNEQEPTVKKFKVEQ